MVIPRTERSTEKEYFSGLNWRDANKLIGKLVQCSTDGERWIGPFTLKKVCDIPEYLVKFKCGNCNYPYIRTCLETYKHTTINIGDTELPRPEVTVPKIGTEFWVFSAFSCTGYTKYIWHGNSTDQNSLERGFIHLTESRVQAWADWWDDTVIKTIKSSN